MFYTELSFSKTLHSEDCCYFKLEKILHQCFNCFKETIFQSLLGLQKLEARILHEIKVG